MLTNIVTEDFIINREALTLKAYNTIYMDRIENSEFMNILNNLLFENSLICILGTPVYPLTNDQNRDYMIDEYNEVDVQKGSLTNDLVENIYLNAEINVPIFIVLNPLADKEYFSKEENKFIINTTSESFLWFDYDAESLYLIK
ncbi:hypothetical protein CHH91_17725 [Virgibacillus sp. 7505]|uniref:hypothetical protein n=1 Tax=Virgibacillus sp. 7505 TaxID=2022548 RepID=UPI000BA5EDD5|nr:hypothetical protein [Virgibacillus sp. 7505]PAE14724.1 hypothetical protein CHH91_17725 [Virgibacillus sp. 7505]